MATFSASDLTSKPRMVGGYGDVVAVSGKVTPTALALNDVLRPLIIPSGHECFAIILANDDLDSNGVPTAAFKMGYKKVSADEGSLADVDNYFVAAGDTSLQAANGGKVYGRFDPKKFEQDVFLELVATAAAATFAAGSVWVTALCRAVGVK